MFHKRITQPTLHIGRHNPLYSYGNKHIQLTYNLPSALIWRQSCRKHCYGRWLPTKDLHHRETIESVTIKAGCRKSKIGETEVCHGTGRTEHPNTKHLSNMRHHWGRRVWGRSRIDGGRDDPYCCLYEVVMRKGTLPLCCLRSETDPLRSEQIYVDDNFHWNAGQLWRDLYACCACWESVQEDNESQFVTWICQECQCCCYIKKRN